MRIRPQTPADHSDTKTALLESARAAARAAASAEFSPDPLFSPDISLLNSVSASASKRHGPLIERAVSVGLKHAGLIVLPNVAVPVSRGALALTTANDYQINANKQIDFDENDIGGSVDLDFIAIDEENGWAGGFQVKRGGGQTEHRKRRSDERALRAVRFTLASWLRQKGYRGIEAAEAGVVDYLGQSKYAKDLTIGRDELDEFFGLPLIGAIDEMTKAMSEALDIEMRRLLAPMLTAFGMSLEATTASTVADDSATHRPRGRKAFKNAVTSNFKGGAIRH